MLNSIARLRVSGKGFECMAPEGGSSETYFLWRDLLLPHESCAGNVPTHWEC
jgi:hypothetical protein